MKAQETWAASKLQLLNLDVHLGSFMDLLWLVMMTNELRKEKCSQVVTMAWVLWSNRNEILYGGEGKIGPTMALWTAHYLQEYWSAMDSFFQATSEPVQHIPTAQQQSLLSAWLPPSVSLLKINVDGALFSSKKLAGIGVVIRDVEGRLKAAFYAEKLQLHWDHSKLKPRPMRLVCCWQGIWGCEMLCWKVIP